MATHDDDALATNVPCPTCGVWEGWACEGDDYGYHTAGYHRARHEAARRARHDGACLLHPREIPAEPPRSISDTLQGMLRQAFAAGAAAAGSGETFEEWHARVTREGETR